MGGVGHAPNGLTNHEARMAKDEVKGETDTRSTCEGCIYYCACGFRQGSSYMYTMWTDICCYFPMQEFMFNIDISTKNIYIKKKKRCSSKRKSNKLHSLA